MRRLAFLTCIVFLAFSAPASGADLNPLNAVVEIRSGVPADARTADTLGTERAGGGILIDGGGLILTIGYLIMEADEVWVMDADSNRVPAETVGYDHETGFGLIRALGPLTATPAPLGSFRDLEVGDTLLAAGPDSARPTVLIGVRPFAGGWEYLLEDALYTSPPIPDFGGAALFAKDGRLVGVGSLILRDIGGGLPGNLYVPVDLLPPILGDLLAFGQATSPAQPWIGLYPNEVDGALVVGRVAPGGPAQTAGIGPGDVILGVGDEPVGDIEQLWRKLRALGPAGVAVPLKVLGGNGVRDVLLTSRDRRGWLKLERSY
ncbi:S1C family serine protease [Thalassobaculum sp. OXR-137]|uniref:S1C family serine protease n=1 Tax=Thalassobaculum sp. OXR-137 TaxID=3100173 RepID=UPI002AC93263|nr:S1C family serine protease [Thalassobaculum sp. OXR-137]WPZ35646.1 S1C family serine protease [Thalassobaculum sp. OXR-137]